MRLKRYQAILVEFMSFINAQKYASDATFTREVLLKITPEDVCKWVNYRAFGEAYPSEGGQACLC